MLSAMASGREGAGLVVASDMIFCIGGYDGTNLLSSAECYDPSNDQWSNILPMTTRRSGLFLYFIFSLNVLSISLIYIDLFVL